MFKSSDANTCFANSQRIIHHSLSGISDFNFFNFEQNHMPAALWCQSQFAVAMVGWQMRFV